MTYQSMSQLRVDATFSGRVQSCVVEQARAAPPDPFTREIKLNPMTATGMFVGLMVTDPVLIAAYEQGGVDAITDEMILADVQAEWDEVSTLYMTAHPPTTPSPPS
jgi:hypothetical protein